MPALSTSTESRVLLAIIQAPRGGRTAPPGSRCAVCEPGLDRPRFATKRQRLAPRWHQRTVGAATVVPPLGHCAAHGPAGNRARAAHALVVSSRATLRL